MPKVGAKVLRAPRALKEELSYPAPKKLLGSKGPLRESSKGRAFKKVPLQSRELAALVSKAASEHKISSPVLINLAGVSQITDFYYIVSAENSRQVRSVAEKIVLRVKEAGLKTLSVEGLAISDTRWVLIDLGDVIVHVFLSEARELYDLEGLFADAPRLDPKSLAPLAGSAKV
ncbi:MAG: ribosome silencing factor [Deltaproteobacteria bacterium]|nr:ribosome silencing factor [Deltaproteobacteria bacterium]